MFESNNFNVAKKVVLPKNQISVECNVACNEQIVKILSVSAEACQNGCEVLSGSVNYSGYIDLTLVFLGEDNQIAKVSSICPFSSKFSGEQIENGQRACLTLKVIECTVDSINGDNVRVNCTLQEKCTLCGNQEVKSVRSDDEDICLLQDKIGVFNFVGEAESIINVQGELQIHDQVKRIIATEAQTIVKNVEGGNGYLTISGDVVFRALYLTENDKFESGYVYQAFKEELELDGVSRESKLEGYADLKRDSIKVTLDQDDKMSKLVFDAPLKLTAKAYNLTETEVIKDIYSTKNVLGITTTSFSMSQVCSSTVVEGKIDGSLTLDEDRPRVDKILFSSGNAISVTNAYLSDGEIVIEGIARSNVVYLNDEDSSLNAVALEVPFVVTDKVADTVCDGEIDVDAIVCDVDVAVKKGRELFYDARIKANVNICYDVVSGVISNVEVTESLPERDCGMEFVYASAGQSAWDIAKSISVKQDVLTAQNPDIVFPLQEDTGLILFYQKQG